MSDEPRPALQWREFHYETRVYAFWDDGDYNISVGRNHDQDPFVHVRADQVHSDGLTMDPAQARKLALALIRTADYCERKQQDDRA